MGKGTHRYRKLGLFKTIKIIYEYGFGHGIHTSITVVIIQIIYCSEMNVKRTQTVKNTSKLIKLQRYLIKHGYAKKCQTAPKNFFTWKLGYKHQNPK